MPLKLNVGLSRKVGEANYGSRGASVNVELELDSTLINEPDKLQERIRQLFGIVRNGVAEELNGSTSTRTAISNGNTHSSPSERQEAGNANPEADRRSRSDRQATPSQVKAIFAITRSKGMDLKRLLHERFNVFRADDLSIGEASRLIDELKKSEGKQG